MAEGTTMVEYLVGRVGLRKATKVAAFVVAWGIYSQNTDDDPLTAKGYASYWGQSESLAFKEQELFRIAFPADKTPDRIWGLYVKAYKERLAAGARSDKAAAQVLALRGDFGVS